MKTARFKEVVERSGVPEPYLLWTPVKQDKPFLRADREGRIMTVHQEFAGQKKDFGLVGYRDEPKAQFLIFPKSLKRFGQKRIVGIDYGLLAQARPTQRPAKNADKLLRRGAARLPAVKTETKNKGDTPVVAFARTAALPPVAKPRNQPAVVVVKPEKPVDAPVMPPAILREIRQALKELRADKAVSAYERLAKLSGQKARAE